MNQPRAPWRRCTNQLNQGWLPLRGLLRKDPLEGDTQGKKEQAEWREQHYREKGTANANPQAGECVRCREEAGGTGGRWGGRRHRG